MTGGRVDERGSAFAELAGFLSSESGSRWCRFLLGGMLVVGDIEMGSLCLFLDMRDGRYFYVGIGPTRVI